MQGAEIELLKKISYTFRQKGTSRKMRNVRVKKKIELRDYTLHAPGEIYEFEKNV